VNEPRFDPAEIGPTPDGARLRIRWKDGEVSEYTPRRLRLACPCARCVDEMTGIRTLQPGSVPENVYPTAIHYVGHYALQFRWSDGHDTGFYPYEYLRRLAEGGENEEEHLDTPSS